MANAPVRNIKANRAGESPNVIQRIFNALRAGYMFGGKRQLYEVFGYPAEVTAEQRMAKYIRQDITGRIVDTPPEETWSYPPTLKCDDSKVVDAWQSIIESRHLDLWATLVQADKMLSFGTFSAIWLGLPGNVTTPAKRIATPDDLAYMYVYGEGTNATIDNYDLDTGSKRFGRPTVYGLSTGKASLTNKVHFTRIVHIVDRPLTGNMASIPRLDQVYNLLDDILKISGGSAETYWLTANRGMQVDVDKEMDLDTDDAAALADELDEFQHQLRRYIRTRGVKITNLGSEIADPSGVFGVLIALLASATGIPQRILMGAEAGQLASEQDRANWSEYMERRHSIFAEPYVLKPLIASFTNIGLLPETDKPITFEWPSSFHQSPLEEAQTQAQFARSVVNISRQAEKGFPLCTLEEGRKVLGLPEQVPAGQKLPEPPPPPAVKAPFGGGPTANEVQNDKRFPIGIFKRTVTGPNGKVYQIEEHYDVNR